MVTILYITMLFFVVFCLVSVIHMTRFDYLSKAVSRRIDVVASQRRALINSGANSDEVEKIAYPNIDQTYDNLKWYKPWERPSTLIVYDKEI